MVIMRRQIFFCVTLTEHHADNPFEESTYKSVVENAFMCDSTIGGYIEKVEVVMMNNGAPYAE